MQWADYGMWKVHYDHKTHRIAKAAVVPGPHYTASGDEIMTREQIIEAMKQGKTFVGVTKHGNIWRKGATIFLVEVDGEDYIRARPTRIAMDSREGLTEF